MASKSSSTDELRSAVGGILERGEEVVSVFLDELLGSKRVRSEIDKTARRAAGARKTVEGNFEALLTLLSLPTRRDYKRLLTRIDELQGSLVNLNMKLDRLLAQSQIPDPKSQDRLPAYRDPDPAAARNEATRVSAQPKRRANRNSRVAGSKSPHRR